jgi:hypothetical protein
MKYIHTTNVQTVMRHIRNRPACKDVFRVFIRSDGKACKFSSDELLAARELAAIGALIVDPKASDTFQPASRMMYEAITTCFSPPAFLPRALPNLLQTGDTALNNADLLYLCDRAVGGRKDLFDWINLWKIEAAQLQYTKRAEDIQDELQVPSARAYRQSFDDIFAFTFGDTHCRGEIPLPLPGTAAPSRPDMVIDGFGVVKYVAHAKPRVVVQHVEDLVWQLMWLAKLHRDTEPPLQAPPPRAILISISRLHHDVLAGYLREAKLVERLQVRRGRDQERAESA